jgi:hypothetical protein
MLATLIDGIQREVEIGGSKKHNDLRIRFDAYTVCRQCATLYETLFSGEYTR